MGIGALAWVIGAGMLAHSGKIVLEVVPERTMIVAGEPVGIHVKCINRSQSTITLNGAGGGEGFVPLFKIVDTANRVVCEGGQRLKRGIFPMKAWTLGPGEVAERSLAINKWCETNGLLGKYTIEVRHLDFNDQSLNVQGVARIEVEPSDANVIAQRVRQTYDKVCNSSFDDELRTLVGELAYSGSPSAVMMVSELVLPSGRHYLKNVAIREDAVSGLATIRTGQSIDLLSKIAEIPEMKAVAVDALRRMYGDIAIAGKPAASGDLSKRLEYMLAQFASR